MQNLSPSLSLFLRMRRNRSKDYVQTCPVLSPAMSVVAIDQGTCDLDVLECAGF